MRVEKEGATWSESMHLQIIVTNKFHLLILLPHVRLFAGVCKELQNHFGVTMPMLEWGGEGSLRY
jgi:hypothetical protein